MRHLHELRSRQGRRTRELVCTLLLAALLGAWLTVALLAGRSSRPVTAGTTWGRTISKLHFDTADRLDELAARHASAGAAPLRRIVVLPLTGAAIHAYDFANLGSAALAKHLRSRIAAGQLPHLQGLDIVEGGLPLLPEDAGVEVILHDLTLHSALEPENFEAILSTRAVFADGAASNLLSRQPFTGSNQTLSWFVRSRISSVARALFILAGVFLVACGFYFAVIYYRLVGGSLRCPSWLAGPVNDLRASTGLIASSLVLLAGFVMLVLVFLLQPRPGDALDERRTHVDIIVDGDEFMLPARDRGVSANPLAPLVERLLSDLVGGLTAGHGPVGVESAAAVGQPFPDWLRNSLPALLRTPATEIRISHGTSWRVFAAAEGEAYTASIDPLWPGLEHERRTALAGTFDTIRSHMAERGLGLPLPWNTNYLRELDPVSMAALRGADASGQARLARLVVSSFQCPALPYLEYWVKEGAARPASERVYAVLLPGLPRSSMRAWESLEGRILTARAVAERVVSAQAIPGNLDFDNERLKTFGPPVATNASPDLVAPIVNWNGVVLEQMPNYATARDLSADAANVFGRLHFDWTAAHALVEDFRQWLWGSDVELERIEVFTIPRIALLWLIAGLGLVFALAGVRCEMSAQGMRWWFPPLMVLFSAVVLPLVTGAWLHSRGDTTRYIVFGYADLAFWGAQFLWYCLAVLPFFDGRARVGYRRDLWMILCMALSVGLAASVPLWPAGSRLWLAQGSLAVTFVLAAGMLTATWWTPISERRQTAPGGRGPPYALRLTLMTVLLVALGYWKTWGWSGQDLPAIFLLVFLVTATVSGWGQGLNWWRISPRADYDRIPWLKPANRLLLALVLTFTGAAALYCSFPADGSGGMIRGYVSYSMVFCVAPFLLCASVLILVDLLERDAL